MFCDYLMSIDENNSLWYYTCLCACNKNVNMMSDGALSISVMLGLSFEFWSILDFRVWFGNSHLVCGVSFRPCKILLAVLLARLSLLSDHTACVGGGLGIIDCPQFRSMSPVVLPPVSPVPFSDSVLGSAVTSGIL